MLYLRQLEQGLVQYPYNPSTLRKENPNTSFPSEMSDSLLAEYGVFPVARTSPPSITIYQRVVEVDPILRDGKWTQQWSIEAAEVPQIITPRQCRLLLLHQGQLASVNAMIAKQDEATRITWEYAIEFHRDDPLLNALAASMGWTDAELDAFFIEASAL